MALMGTTEQGETCGTREGTNRRFPERPQAAPRAKHRLLVVDDDARMCELLSLYFGHHGLDVTTTTTVKGAIALIEQGEFDLAILDWRLDGGDGLDLLNLSKGLHPDIPVIIFTGAEDNENFLQTTLAGRGVVVRKDNSLQGLSTEVRRHLTRSER
jgi:DNA-binding response OmpR family regulator